MDETIWRLSADLSAQATLRLETALSEHFEALGDTPPTLSYFEQKHTPLWKVEVFFVGGPSSELIDQLFEKADLAGNPYHIEPLEAKDWVAETQRLLDPVAAGCFYVHGSHDPDTSEDHLINLTVDAGQAFGTGRHETTWACLAALDSMSAAEPVSILDLGTGSGLLAMAATKLWPDATILATDIDPVAVEVAHRNVRLNSCSVRTVGADDSGIALLTADGLQDSAFRIEGPFDLIIANILAGPLIDLAPGLAPIMKRGGHILLSGLLIEQEAEVLAAYQHQGLSLKSTLHRGEWSALLLTAS